MRFGLLVSGGDGHLNPLLALGCSLQDSSHHVAFFALPDNLMAAKKAGIQVIECAASKVPMGTVSSITKLYAKGTLPKKSSGALVQDDMIREAYLLEVDDWLTQNPNQLDCLLVDSLAPHLYLLGEKHHIPYILLEFSIPALLSSPNMPPMMLGWDFSGSWFGRMRDLITDALYTQVTNSFFHVLLHKYASIWNLPLSKRIGDPRQALGRISQVPASFDFPRRDKDKYIYTSPWINSSKRVQLDFPWEQLNDKPLIYAALGSIYNDQQAVYETIIQACFLLDCQLVLSVGPHIPDEVLKDWKQQFPQFVLVRKAPQVELLQRAKLFITHAGMNSTLEALQTGVPMVAIPLGNDQPGVAARIRYHQVGMSISIKRLSVRRLHKAIEEVLSQDIYYNKALTFAKLIKEKRGLTLAQEAINRLLTH